MILLIIAVLAAVIIPAALLLKRARVTRSEGEDHKRSELTGYQVLAKSAPSGAPDPVSVTVPEEESFSPGTVVYTMENCHDLRQGILALTGKYSLDSLTIATSDGLVLASSNGSPAQEDAAFFSGRHPGKQPEGVTLFSLNHKGSGLTGIIRTQGIITWETQSRIESDTKDILNRWL